MEIITITSLETKEKLTFVNTTDNRKLRCWNNKIGQLGLEQGATYEVETEGSQYGTHVTKAKRLAAPSTDAATRRPAPTATGTPFRTPEQLFVQGVVEAYIGAGKCANPSELRQTMRTLCDAFRATWPETEHYSQAAE